MTRLKRFFTLLTIWVVNTTAAAGTALPDFLKHYNSCFILYSVKQHKIVSQYDSAKQCQTRIAADSTFKIALSLMAFDQHIIQQNTIFKWNGKPWAFPAWNHDQTPKSWLQNSTVWVSQGITPQLGYARINKYLAEFNYGNQDFTGDPGKNNGLQYAWLASSLKISAEEQLKFLQAMLKNTLPLATDAVTNTISNMYQGTLAHGATLYAKSGAGRHGNNERESNPSKLRDGWYVGFVKQGGEDYIFVSNLSDKAPPAVNDKLYGSAILKPVVIEWLNDYFS